MVWQHTIGAEKDGVFHPDGWESTVSEPDFKLRLLVCLSCQLVQVLAVLPVLIVPWITARPSLPYSDSEQTSAFVDSRLAEVHVGVIVRACLRFFTQVTYAVGRGDNYYLKLWDEKPHQHGQIMVFCNVYTPRAGEDYPMEPHRYCLACLRVP